MFYGLMVAIMLLLAWRSKSHAEQKLGLLMLASWSPSNVAVTLYGLSAAWAVIPSVDAVIAVIAAMVALQYRSLVGLGVVLLFVAEALTHLVAIISHSEGSYGYYATLNIIFAAQVVWIGVSAGERVYRRGIDRVHQRVSRHGFGG